MVYHMITIASCIDNGIFFRFLMIAASVRLALLSTDRLLYISVKICIKPLRNIVRKLMW